MNTEKLKDFVASLNIINEEKLAQWFQSRHTSSTAESTGGIKSIFPIVYKKGNDFEILPYLDLARKDEVWGYEILSGIILAKKCGGDGNYETTTWDHVKSFAERCSLNGKQGELPSKEVLAKICGQELEENIQKMDEFLCKNGINAQKEFKATLLWCSGDFGRTDSGYVTLKGRANWYFKDMCFSGARICVAFQ